MQTDSSTVALNNALNEVKNVCPGLSHTFIFREDNQILAKDHNTTTDEVNSTKQAFSAIEQRANTIGRIESISFSGSNGRVYISCINDFYLIAHSSFCKICIGKEYKLKRSNRAFERHFGNARYQCSTLPILKELV